MTGGKAGRTCLATNYCVDKTVCPTSCQCQSVVNKTHDGFYCLPEEGFTTYTPAADEWETKPKVNKLRLDPSQHICVDQAKPPIVAIEGANPMVIPQGDEYDELGATVRRAEGGALGVFTDTLASSEEGGGVKPWVGSKVGSACRVSQTLLP